MSYRFVIGSAGAGKSRAIRQEIIARARASLKKGGAQEPAEYLFIVPEQYTMQTQFDLVREDPSGGIMNIDVLSFARLAHRIFEETGTETGTVIDDTGKMLVLRKIAGDCRGQLDVLQKGIHRPGMIAEVKSVLSEFMQYDVQPDQVDALISYARANGQGALEARLKDLLVLYRAFAEYEEGRFITAEETTGLLAACLPKARSVQGAVIVFEGFTDFTPVQYRVIRELLGCAKEVIFSITGPAEDGRQRWEAAAAGRIGSEQALFYASRKMVRDLTVIAQAAGASHGEDLYLSGGRRFASAPALAHLEREIFRSPAGVYTEDPGDSLQCRAARDPESEARAACMQIRSLVLEKGYDYRDIAVVTGDLDTYGPLIEKMAARSGIPVYLDRTSMILQSPLTDGIRSALSVVTESFSYESVFRYLRSGLSRITPEEADRLENYCLRHGIQGRKKWSTAFDEENEASRRRLLAELEPLTGPAEERAGGRRHMTAGQRTEALYAFLTGVDAFAATEKIADDFAAAGDPVQERLYRQLYGALMHLLEQIWQLLGDEEISAKDYLELLEAGCSAVRLGTLPQKADRILVGDIRRTRLPEVRVLFVTGVNDGIIPQAASKGGILSDMDREFLKRSNLELAPAPRERMFAQRFYLYRGMTKASDALLLSWSDTGADGKSLRPSYLIETLRKMFPSMRLTRSEETSPEDGISCVRDAMPQAAASLHALSEGRSGREAVTLYGTLYAYAGTEEKERLRALREAAFFRYAPEKLRPETAAALYGNTLEGSVTMLETAAGCMMRQFLRYGLRLKEREEYIFRPVDAGTVLHAGMERFSGMLRERGVKWTQLPPELTGKLVKDALEETAALYHDLILYATKRSEHRLHRMEEILLRSVQALCYQLEQGDFEPWAYELVFGEGRRGGQLRYPLSRGRQLLLRGKIDRVDLCRQEEGTYVKILDYKSGNRDLDVQEMLAGRQVQLLLYMNAVLRMLSGEGDGRKAFPSAMLYFHLTDPVLKESDVADPAEADSGEDPYREVMLGRMRPTGMVRTGGPDPELLDHSGDKRSKVIPLNRKKDGTPGAGSQVYTQEEFDALTETVGAKIREIAEAVLDGEHSAFPARPEPEKSACKYCEFREVCGFDLKTPGYHYSR